MKTVKEQLQRMKEIRENEIRLIKGFLKDEEDKAKATKYEEEIKTHKEKIAEYEEKIEKEEEAE